MVARSTTRRLKIFAFRQFNGWKLGEAPSAVMRVLGFARTVIYDWLTKYRAGGIEALRALPIPGRPLMHPLI